jgi:M6 family metalloprotease-like protein
MKRNLCGNSRRNLGRFSGIILFLLLAWVSAQAAYLRNVPVTVTQPNGEKLALYASGDEFYNWLHDKAGYTIIQDKDTGYYVYAKDSNGLLVSSGLVVSLDAALNQRGVDALALPKYLTVAPKLRPKPSELFPEGSAANPNLILQAPHSGTLNNIVIFIRFLGESEFTDAISIYDNMFNNVTASYNSMRNYYAEASYSALAISTTFYPAPTTTVVSYQDSHDRNYYMPYNATTNPTGYTGGDSGTQRRDREHALLKNAVDAVSAGIPAGLNIDGDGDGYVDNVCFIIDGDPTAWATLLWPHMWSLYSVTANINGKRVYTYNFQLQNTMTSAGVGVLCHEMFHSLGAPDLYHYSYDGLHPAYMWDLMEYDLNPPQHMTSYMKYKYGTWIASIPEITTAGTYSLNPLTSATNHCYKIASPFSSTEYFVLEYRKKTTTFESSLPGEGLLVMRINSAYTGNASGPPDELYIYRPNGTTTADGSPGSANYNSAVGRTAIDDSTNPSSFLTDGSMGGLSISNIGAVGSTISFTVGFPFAGTKPLNIKATNTGTSITVSPNDVQGHGDGTTDFTRIYPDGQSVSLTAPATSGSLNFQKWYLDGAEYATTAATTLTMDAVHSALAVYGVDLGEAVDNTALTWYTQGKGWFGQTTTYSSGNDAAQSAPITHNEKTFMSTTVLGPGTVTWLWRISCEYQYDYSYFYIDGTKIWSYTGIGSSWYAATQAVPAGVHTLTWSYEKDESVSSGSDCAWVDLVTYTNGRAWQILSGVNPEAAMRVNTSGTAADQLVGDFGSVGMWLYGAGNWQILSSVNPQGMVAADVDGNGTQEIVGDFGPIGLWLYNTGSWQILSGVNPDNVIAADLDGNGTQEIIGDFGSLGVWARNGTAWSQLSGVNPEGMLAANTDGVTGQELIVDFGATGLWLRHGSAWTLISANNAEMMIRADVNNDGRDEAYIDFGAAGLWQYDYGSWAQISSGNVENMIAANTDAMGGDEIIGDFGASGVSMWKSGAWTLLTGSNPAAMAAVKMDGDNKDVIVASFPSLGVFKWKSGTWTIMTGTAAENIGGADLNGDTFVRAVIDFGALGLWIW